MSPMIFVEVFSEYICLGRTDWAHWHFISSTLHFSPWTATNADARELSNATTTASDWLKQSGVRNLLLQGVTMVCVEGEKSVTHSLPQSDYFSQAAKNRSVMTQLLAPSTLSVVMM